MGCNCNKTSLCNRCNKGLTCQCPPDYSIQALPVACGCCATGYTWSGATPNWPNGVCTGPGGVQTAPIPCTPCETALSADCVMIPAIPCLGLPAMTLTAFLSYLCTPAFWLKGLGVIAADTTTSALFCNMASACPSTPSGTTPITGVIIPGP